jgi:hypothetical protein
MQVRRAVCTGHFFFWYGSKGSMVAAAAVDVLCEVSSELMSITPPRPCCGGNDAVDDDDDDN